MALRRRESRLMKSHFFIQKKLSFMSDEVMKRHALPVFNCIEDEASVWNIIENVLVLLCQFCRPYWNINCVISVVLSVFYARDTVYRGVFFHVPQNLQKCKRYVSFLICVSHFLRYPKFLIEIITGYNFCEFNIFRLERDRGKSEN